MHAYIHNVSTTVYTPCVKHVIVAYMAYIPTVVTSYHRWFYNPNHEMWYDVMWHDANVMSMWCKYDVVSFDLVWSDLVWSGAVLCSVIWSGPIWSGAVQCGTLPYTMVFHAMLRSAINRSTHLIRCGVAVAVQCRGMMWRDVKCYAV